MERIVQAKRKELAAARKTVPLDTLVGEALLRAADIAAEVRELLGTTA